MGSQETSMTEQLSTSYTGAAASPDYREEGPSSLPLLQCPENQHELILLTVNLGGCAGVRGSLDTGKCEDSKFKETFRKSQLESSGVVL